MDKFLLRELSDYSRTFLQKIIKQDLVFVNGKKAKQSYILKNGDVVSVEIPEKEEMSLKPDSSIKYEVLYEDKNIIVVNKPAGLTVHPSENEPKGTLVNGLLAKYPDIKDVGEDRLRPGIVHRLDKDTSGVMIVARNDKTFQFLKDQFKSRKTIKKYIALVAGDIKKSSGVINFPIARKKNLPTKQVAVKDERQARGTIREAVTEYKIVRHLNIDGKDFTLVEVSPKTGRLHQIRVHFSAIGHPVAGDIKYGSKDKISIKNLHRQFLHAESLEIDVPSGDEGGFKKMIFKAPLPKELASLIK